MTQLQIIFLSALQGFTEFLPVSSSGHLILFSKFTAFPDQGLEMDIAVHVGSILAVAIYFYRDIWEMLCGLLNAIFSRFSRVREYYLHHASDKMKIFIAKTLPQYDCKLLLMLVVGTIPAVFFGLLLHHFGMEWLRSTKIVGWNILLFGIILWIADRYRPSARQITDMTLKDAVIIGFAQCMAMIPGTSRSGITITASRFLGINRREAAKFCMLLSFPAIAGAGLLTAVEIWQSGDLSRLHDAFSGIGYSFIASLAAIFIMMSWLKNYTFLPFVIYRIGLGSFLLLYSYGYI